MLRIQRVVRPGSVLLLGVLLGGMAVVMAPAAARLTGGEPDGAEGVIIKTRTASCAGSAFVPSTSSTEYSTDYSSGVRTPLTLSPAEFWCDPGLPGKATVTKVVFDVEDNVAWSRVECSLRGMPLTAGDDPAYDMAAGSTSEAGTPGRVLLTDSSIVGNPTNTANSSYALYCVLHGGDVGLWGASITYKISAGNG